MTTAIVLGGGFAGVLAATVLARHVEDVTVVESARYPSEPVARLGLPQAHHSHLLVTGGALALDRLLPGTVAALIARGAHRRGLSGDTLILSTEGWFRRHDTEAYVISGSRWLMDHVIRRRALAGGRVTVRDGVRVLGLLGNPARVTGVVVGRDNGRTETIRADLVVDATGRRSRAGRWLAGIGADGVEETTVDPGLAYSTRIYRAPADLAATIPAIMVHPRPESGRPGHGATLFPIEDDRWIVTLTGTREGRPPTDEPGFTDAAYALPSPVIAELMSVAKPLTGVRPYRATANRRRHFERGARPDGFLVLGDALMAVNPVHSHGLSVAALSALRLDHELDRRGTDPAVLRPVQVAMAEEGERSWRMAIDQDRPRQRPATPYEHLVATRMSRAVVSSPALMARLFRAQALVPPESTVETPSPRDLAGKLPPPLTTDEAIAQYPALSDWWLSGHVGRKP